MLTYEQFKKAIDGLKAFEKEQEKLDAALKIISPSSTGVVEFGNWFIDDYIKLFEAAIGNESNLISWFVFENEYGTKGYSIINNGKEYKINTDKDLYDFIAETIHDGKHGTQNFKTSTIQPDGRIYYANTASTLNVLIPKKRGKGFLKRPIGLNRNRLSEIIEEKSYGTDWTITGYLYIEIGAGHERDGRGAELLRKISRQLNGAEVVEVGIAELLDYVIENNS